MDHSNCVCFSISEGVITPGLPVILPREEFGRPFIPCGSKKIQLSDDLIRSSGNRVFQCRVSNLTREGLLRADEDANPSAALVGINLEVGEPDCFYEEFWLERSLNSRGLDSVNKLKYPLFKRLAGPELNGSYCLDLFRATEFISTPDQDFAVAAKKVNIRLLALIEWGTELNLVSKVNRQITQRRGFLAFILGNVYDSSIETIASLTFPSPNSSPTLELNEKVQLQNLSLNSRQ